MVELLVNILNKVLGSGLQQQDLIIVVAVVREVAAFFAYQFIMDNAKSNIRLHVILALNVGCILRLLRLLIIPLECGKIVLNSEAASLITVWICVHAFSLSFSFSIVLGMVLMPLRLLGLLVGTLINLTRQ